MDKEDDPSTRIGTLGFILFFVSLITIGGMVFFKSPQPQGVLRKIPLSEISRPQPAGAPWDHPGNLILDSHGVEILLGEPTHAPAVEFSCDSNDEYQVLYFFKGRKVAEQSTLPRYTPGILINQLKVPLFARLKGYDAVRIVPVRGDGYYSVGHLRLLPEEKR